MVFLGWAEHPELRDNFFRQYLNNDDYNSWYVGCSGADLIYPDNNPNECYTRWMKQEDGSRCQTGRDLTAMITEEFPSHIYAASARKLGVASVASCGYKVDNEDSVFTRSDDLDRLLEYGREIANGHGIVGMPSDGSTPSPTPGDERNTVFYCNTNGDHAEPVTRERIIAYKAALEGRCEGHETDASFGTQPSERAWFVSCVTSLCKVVKHTVNGQMHFRGSCKQFLQEGYCPHSAYLKYKEKIEKYGERIPTGRNKKKRGKHEMSGSARIKDILEKCVEISQYITRVKESAHTARENLLQTDKVQASLVEARLSAITNLPDAYDWYRKKIKEKKINRILMLRHMEHAEAALRPAIDLESSFEAFLLQNSAQSQKCTSVVDADIESLRWNLAILTGGKGRNSLSTKSQALKRGEKGHQHGVTPRKPPPPSADAHQCFLVDDSLMSQKSTSIVDADIESLELNLAMLTRGGAGKTTTTSLPTRHGATSPMLVATQVGTRQTELVGVQRRKLPKRKAKQDPKWKAKQDPKRLAKQDPVPVQRKSRRARRPSAKLREG